jgi:uncharacterized protein (TIGR02996 family)
VVHLWLAARDVRTFAAMREVPMLPPDKKLLAMAADKKRPKLAAADVPRFDAIQIELRRLEEPMRTECALVDEIAANPDIDDPYLVYADWLLERDRPLGELIALSCQRKRTPTQARRHAQLLALPYLHGPFEDLPGHRHPRPRGIDLDIMVPWKTSPRTWEVAATSPLVRALTRIEMVGPAIGGLEHAMAKLVAAAPALERISHLSKETGHALLELVDGFELEPSGEIATPVRAHAPFRLRGSYEPTFGVTLIRVGRSR